MDMEVPYLALLPDHCCVLLEGLQCLEVRIAPGISRVVISFKGKLPLYSKCVFYTCL